jgi:hypothetical protein
MSAAMDLPAAFTPELINAVQTIIGKAIRCGAFVEHWETTQAMLLKTGLGVYMQLPPEFCGVHKDNRNKFLLTGPDAHAHGEEILDMGWSNKKASDATASEMPPPGHPNNIENTKLNDDLVANSQGYIPPLVQCKILSLGAGHTNTFLRGVKANVKSASAKLADEHGNLSLANLGKDRPAFAEAVTNGLNWFVISWQCLEVWPMLTTLVVGALNADARGIQGELQCMLAIHQAHEVQLKNGGPTDWHAIEEHAKRSLPTCSSWMSSVRKYVQNNAGGPSGELLHDLASFQKTIPSKTKTSKLIGGDFLEKAASLQFGNKERYPYVVNGAVKALLCGSKIVDGFYKSLLPTHLGALTLAANRPLVQCAERNMEHARDLISRMHLGRSVVSGPLGIFDARNALHIMKRGDLVEGRSFESLDEIVSDLCFLQSTSNGIDGVEYKSTTCMHVSFYGSEYTSVCSQVAMLNRMCACVYIYIEW